MNIFSQIIIGLIALLHFYIFIIEVFFWEIKGPKMFKSLDKDLFKKTKQMAGNQGVYNLFLSAGLFWGLLISDLLWSVSISFFFLVCVFIAGIFATFTIEKKVFFIQSVPAIIAIISLIFIV